MSAFDDEFAESAFPDLLDRFGTSFTYKPYGGSPRTITGIITTDALQALAGIDDAPSSTALIRVLNDPDNSTYGGIDASAIAEGRDKVTIALKNGGSLVDVAIVKLLNDDAGVTSFAAR